MKKATLIIANAIIWGVVLLACAIALRGTEAFQDIQTILGGGAVVSMLIVAVSAKQPKQTAAKSK
jgi:hypothetical protein